MPVDPTVTVTLAATIGEVTVMGWNRAELSVEVDRFSASSASLERLPVDVTESPATVRVAVTQREGGRDPALRSIIRLRMPHQGALAADLFEGTMKIAHLRNKVTAHVRRGRLEAEHVGGTVRLETGIGDIRIRDGTLDPGGLLRLRTFNGNAELQLKDRPASARVLAVALNGTITSDIPLTVRDKAGPRFGEATIGSGEPLISIDTVNGNIELRLVRKTGPPSRDASGRDLDESRKAGSGRQAGSRH